MKCPQCGAELQTIIWHGVRIGQCPLCRGQWLDQGELERLLKWVSILERRHGRRVYAGEYLET